jgi:hypothetical protein
MLVPPYLPLWSLLGRKVCFASWVPVSALGKWFWLNLNRAGFEVWHASKSVHATVLVVWPCGRDHRVCVCCWSAMARPLSLDSPRATQCHVVSMAMRWPALAGRGLAPDVAMPSAELSRGDGYVTGPTWCRPAIQSTYRIEATYLRCHVGTKALIACPTAYFARSVTPRPQ